MKLSPKVTPGFAVAMRSLRSCSSEAFNHSSVSLSHRFPALLSFSPLFKRRTNQMNAGPVIGSFSQTLLHFNDSRTLFLETVSHAMTSDSTDS